MIDDVHEWITWIIGKATKQEAIRIYTWWVKFASDTNDTASSFVSDNKRRDSTVGKKDMYIQLWNYISTKYANKKTYDQIKMK